MTGLHILEKLQTILCWQLSLYNLINWLFEILSWQALHKAACTTVILNEYPLRLIHTLFLIEVILIFIYPLPTLITLCGSFPCEILTIGIWLSLVISADDLGAELLAHDFLDGDCLLCGVGVSRLGLPQRLILREQTHRVHQIQIRVTLQVLVSVQLYCVGEVGLLQFQGCLLL